MGSPWGATHPSMPPPLLPLATTMAARGCRRHGGFPKRRIWPGGFHLDSKWRFPNPIFP